MGVYKIALNFYKGIDSTSTAQAHVEIKAGTRTYSKDIALTPPIAYDGDDNPPYFIANITVAKDPTTSDFIYTISP